VITGPGVAVWPGAGVAEAPGPGVAPWPGVAVLLPLSEGAGAPPISAPPAQAAKPRVAAPAELRMKPRRVMRNLDMKNTALVLKK
jgi:hypothetical protein